MHVIRAERPEDQAAVRRVNELAFGQPSEAKLVDALRQAARPMVSLVAVDGDNVVGHIFFSAVTIESEQGSSPAMGLAPMAVLPAWQNKGIGSDLVRRGLAECARLGEMVVVVLGHAAFYPRFGFVSASVYGLSCEYPVHDGDFMVIELEPGALAGRRGLVRYRPEFAEV